MTLFTPLLNDYLLFSEQMNDRNLGHKKNHKPCVYYHCRVINILIKKLIEDADFPSSVEEL